MGHAVHHRDPSGGIQFEEVASLDAALELVERLRNEDGATDVRVFREVPIEVRTYYRVVAVEPEAPATAAVATSEPPSGAMPLQPSAFGAAPEAVADPDDVEDESAPVVEQRRALFSRS